MPPSNGLAQGWVLLVVAKRDQAVGGHRIHTYFRVEDYVIFGAPERALHLQRDSDWRHLRRHFLGAGETYHLPIPPELLTGGDVSSADEIAPGTGAVLRRGLTKVAVHRDPEDQTHEYSAVCPHLGGVAWYTGGSWDCPGPGSRFDALGKLLIGPANQDLTSAES